MTVTKRRRVVGTGVKSPVPGNAAKTGHKPGYILEMPLNIRFWFRYCHLGVGGDFILKLKQFALMGNCNRTRQNEVHPTINNRNENKSIHKEENTMSTQFAGYSDAFASTPGSAPAEENKFHKLARAIRKTKKKNKLLKRTIKELRETAEKQRVADEERRKIEETRKDEPTFFKKVCEFFKVIAPVIVAFIPAFLKGLFSRRDDQDKLADDVKEMKDILSRKIKYA